MGTLKDILGFVGEHPILTAALALFTLGAGVECVKYISQYKPEIEHRQVIGGPIEDTYVEINGERYFSKVDGVPIEENSQR